MTRKSFHLAALLLTAAAAPARAQVGAEAPTQIHTPTLKSHRRAHSEDLSWMFSYLEPLPAGDEARLASDPRFETFLKQQLLAPQSFWAGGAKPLAEVARQFLSGVDGSVHLVDNRYLLVSAAIPHFHPNRGLLWIDTGVPKPMVVFAAVDWVSENRATDDKAATFAMWVFPSRALDPHHFSPALARSIGRWTIDPSSGWTEANPQQITRVFLVDPDGTPHPVTPGTIGVRSTLAAETHTDPEPDPDPRTLGHTNIDRSRAGHTDAAAPTNSEASPKANSEANPKANP